jgi:hypothetical protein
VNRGRMWHMKSSVNKAFTTALCAKTQFTQKTGHFGSDRRFVRTFCSTHATPSPPTIVGFVTNVGTR